MISLYRIVVDLAVLPLSLALSRNDNFRGTILQRLSVEMPGIESGRDLVWVHAASVGEVKAVAGLVKTLKEREPELRICMSTMTVTGRKVAEGLECVDEVFAFPFDLGLVMRRYLRVLDPSVLVIAETEIWPNLLVEAERADVPVVFANARMSSRSFGRYRRLRGFFREILGNARVLAIARDDCERFRMLGAKSVEVLGNLKLDYTASAGSDRREAVRSSLGAEGRPVLVCGSVREGEEEGVVRAVAEVKKRDSSLLCVLAPRHPGQIDTVRGLAGRMGLTCGLRSTKDTGKDLVVVDTFGELFDLYGASDVAFVGGSIADMGGQNILEPVAWGVPTVHGPHMDNFLWALDVLGGNTIEVEDFDAFAGVVCDILERPGDYAKMAADARACLEGCRGVTMRYADVVDRIVKEKKSNDLNPYES